MSDYGWFVVKSVAIIAVIGLAVWLTASGFPLLALLFLPSWTGSSDDET